MIFSMTGFGRSTTTIQDITYSIEIKCLNSKQLDLNMRAPNIFRSKEMELRKEIGSILLRGKIELYISASNSENNAAAKLNKKVIDEYLKQIGTLNIGNSDVLNAVLKLPNVLDTEEQELSESDYKIFLHSLKNALENVLDFRKQEGKALQIDFEKRIENIQQAQAEIEKIAPDRAENRKEKLRNNLAQLDSDLEINKDRFEQEIIYYLEKYDITEEFTRLSNHTKFYLETMNSDESSKGKKLNFIAQEIGREINTIGSKANDMHIQQLVVEMKDELEKIKEQLGNVL